jgi:type I restriction enzyme S subunit
MTNWKEYKVEDFAEVIGGGTPSTKNEAYFGGSIPWITPRDLTNYDSKFIKNGDRNITKEGLKNSSAKLIPKNAILLTSRAPIGYLVIAQNEVSTNQGFKSIVVNPEIADYNFIFYLIKANIERIKSFGTGTTFAEVSASIVKNLKFNLPPLPTQTAIAEILSSLDDKIELNNKINQELENLAQALFKQWFIDFEFPNENGDPYKSSGGEMVDSELGEIPKGWEVKALGELIKLTGGGTPKRSNLEYWDGNIKWFSIQDVPQNSQVFVIDTKETISQVGLAKSSTKLLPKGSTIITARGTVGKLALVAEPMAMNQSCYAVNGACDLGDFFTYFNLKNAVEQLRQNTHGAVFDTITSNTFDTIKSVFGSLDLANLFEKLISPTMHMIESSCREDKELTNLRDTLLPKLISGELEVSEALAQKV